MLLKINSNPIPDEQLEKRKELEKLLEKDIKELEMLQTAIDTTQNATVKVASILSSFDSRLSKLETYIMPIHISTQELTRKNNSDFR
jgi:DNA polymerase II small subunit/DNA polymerase delta subunit B